MRAWTEWQEAIAMRDRMTARARTETYTRFQHRVEGARQRFMQLGQQP